VFLAVALLTSCDPGTPYQYFLDVTNGCTGDLYVIVTRDGNGSRGDFTKVAAGATVTVHPIRDGLYVPDGTIIVTATLRDGDPAVFDDPDFEHDPNVAIGSLRDVVVTNTPGIGEGGSYRIEGDLCRVAEPSNP
jgi:hypothetical protein